MEIQQLRYFVALSKERHFLRAAEKTNVSQPTLSQQIKKLEDELGGPLFERSPRNLRLTPAGEKFLPYAMEVLQTLERGVSDLKQDSTEIAGKVRLAAIPTICAYLMPQVITRLKAEAPKLTLELYEETTSMLLAHLKEGGIDLGLLSPPVDEKGFSVLSLGKEKFYLAVSKKHPLANQSSVDPKRLAKERLLVLQEGHCFGGQSLEYCKMAVKNPQVIFKGSSLLSVMRLAASGDGVTFVPEMALQSGPDKNLRFIPFSAPEPTREIGIAWRVSSPLSRAQNFLIKLIGEALNKRR